MSKTLVRNLIFTALFTVLCVLGTYIKIPVGPVPIVLTNLFVVLAGLFLGPLWGAASIGLYLLLGLLGLPVFSAGSGLGVLLGPTGGYLFGYLLCAVSSGLIVRIGKAHFIKAALAVVVGTLVLYGLGVPWLKFSIEGMSWSSALIKGCAVFLPGDVIKAFLAVVLWRSLIPLWEDPRWSSKKESEEQA